MGKNMEAVDIDGTQPYVVRDTSVLSPEIHFVVQQELHFFQFETCTNFLLRAEYKIKSQGTNNCTL